MVLTNCALVIFDQFFWLTYVIQILGYVWPVFLNETLLVFSRRYFLSVVKVFLLLFFHIIVSFNFKCFESAKCTFNNVEIIRLQFKSVNVS